MTRRTTPSNIGTERLLYCDFLDPNADPRIYQEVEDIDKLNLLSMIFSRSTTPRARARCRCARAASCYRRPDATLVAINEVEDIERMLHTQVMFLDAESSRCRWSE